MVGKAKLETGYKGKYEWFENKQTFENDMPTD